MNLTSLLEFLGLQPSLKSANAMYGQARSTDGSTFDALLALEAGPDVMEPVSAPVNDALRAPVQGNLSALMHPGQTAALSIDQADVRHSGIDLPASESMPGKGLPQGSLQGSSLIKPIPVDQDQSHRAVAEIGLEPDLVMADPRATQQAVESQKADIPVSGAPETIPGQNAYNLPVGESAPTAGSAREPSLGVGDRLRPGLDSEPMRARVASSDRGSEMRPPLSFAAPRQGPIGGADADSALASREPSYRSPDGVPVPPAGMGTRRNTLGRPSALSAMPAETPAVAEHADDVALEGRPKRSAVDAILQTQQQRAAAPRVAHGSASPADAGAYAEAYQGRAGMEPAISGVVSEITAEPHKGTVDASRAVSTSSVESVPSVASARAVAEAVPANRSESVVEIRSGSVVQLPEMARDNVDSIANRLAGRVSMLHATRGHQATVMLEPLELGRIEVKVRMQADTTHLSFAVQHAPVRDVVETHMARLRTMLEDAGLSLGDVDVGDLAQGHPEPEARYPAPSVPGFESDADITGPEGEVSSTAPVASNSLIDVHA